MIESQLEYRGSEDGRIVHLHDCLVNLLKAFGYEAVNVREVMRSSPGFGTVLDIAVIKRERNGSVHAYPLSVAIEGIEADKKRLDIFMEASRQAGFY